MARFERNIKEEVFPEGLGDGQRLFVFFDRKELPRKYEVVLVGEKGGEELLGGNYWGSDCSADEAIEGIWRTPDEIERERRRMEQFAPVEARPGKAAGDRPKPKRQLDASGLEKELGDVPVSIVIYWGCDDEKGSWEEYRDFRSAEIGKSLRLDRAMARNVVNGKYGYAYIRYASVDIAGDKRYVDAPDGAEMDAELTLYLLNEWLEERE